MNIIKSPGKDAIKSLIPMHLKYRISKGNHINVHYN